MGSSPRHVVLVGLMGSGKSSVGRRLAERTGRRFVDTDRAIEDAHHQTVREMFDSVGEQEFRRRESVVLRHALDSPTSSVVAAGGGVVLSSENRNLLLAASAEGRAIVVWLDTEPEALVERVRRGSHRPLLDADPRGTLESMFVQRREFYAEVATRVVNTTGRGVEEVLSDVADLVMAGESRDDV